jgi:hypothetical protein
LLDAFKGILCCDYFSAYEKFIKTLFPRVRVQFCMAHLKRELTFLEQHLCDPELSAYGRRLLDIFAELFKKLKLYRRLKLPRNPDEPGDPGLVGEAREAKAQEVLEEMRRLARRFKEVVLDCPARSKARNIAKRILEWPEDFYFTFLTDEGLALEIDATNNRAEQTVRAAVIDRHVTGTKSPKGRERCERTWTVISTCAIQGRAAFAFIKDPSWPISAASERPPPCSHRSSKTEQQAPPIPQASPPATPGGFFI